MENLDILVLSVFLTQEKVIFESLTHTLELRSKNFSAFTITIVNFADNSLLPLTENWEISRFCFNLALLSHWLLLYFYKWQQPKPKIFFSLFAACRMCCCSFVTQVIYGIICFCTIALTLGSMFTPGHKGQQRVRENFKCDEKSNILSKCIIE